MNNKEEILKKLLNNLLESRLKRLEKRNVEQMKDIKLEKESYQKQGLLLKKLCSVKIEPKKTLKKNMTQDRFPRGRDKTPNYTRTRRKNSINLDDKKMSRSKTPNTFVRKKRPEPKEKNENLKKSKTPAKIIKKAPNSKIPSYMMSTSSNMNKNKKYNNKTSNKLSGTKKAKTPDERNNKTLTKKPIKKINKDTLENNLKLIDLSVEDMKEFITPLEEVKPKLVEETNKEEKKIINFDSLINDNIINSLTTFLDKETQYSLLSCNKKLTKYLYDKLMISFENFKKENEITPTSTIRDQINSLKLKYKEEEFHAEPPKFTLAKSTTKAIELLNGDTYNKIFRNKELKPPLDEILLIYRIFFHLYKVNNIYSIKDQKLFWLEASDYILNNNNGKTGEFFKESINNYDFSIKNIYEINKIIYGQKDKIKPTVFSSICGTTGLVIFLIKDALEYIGVLHNSKKNIPSLVLKYLEYVEQMQHKIEKYINFIKRFNDNV